MEDYLLSNDLLLNEDDGRSAIEKLYWSVEREWLEASFESIEESHGSIDAYIEKALKPFTIKCTPFNVANNTSTDEALT